MLKGLREVWVLIRKTQMVVTFPDREASISRWRPVRKVQVVCGQIRLMGAWHIGERVSTSSSITAVVALLNSTDYEY